MAISDIISQIQSSLISLYFFYEKSIFVKLWHHASGRKFYYHRLTVHSVVRIRLHHKK